MQFTATTELLHVMLKSFFVFAALLSDYLLKFDEWIVTRPDFNGDSNAERKKWIAVLKTSLAYAVLEPLAYCLMTNISTASSWCLMMGCILHLSAIPSTVILMGECMIKVAKKHNEICDGPKVPIAAEQSTSNQQSEKTAAAESGFPEDDVKSEEQLPSPKVDLRACLDRHPLPRVYPFLTLLPVASAAMANAGLLFYTRYLPTEDSQEWYDKFAFGWTVIAVLSAFMLTMCRYNNKMLHQACGRPLHLTTVPWDVLKYRIPALALMVLVRSGVRMMLSQSAFTWFAFTIEGGVRLLGHVDTSDGPGTSRDNKKHILDRMLSAIPPWVGSTISIVYATGIWAYVFYSWWQKRRQQQRNEQTSE
ncbi:hypothetical protein PRZ48_007684 [Zasmidium cellare]|uniref:Uncharacterized protein n=1 Tax=Zasmidium cellare TaxID=395010 RepID=A0ABR0EK27_ZASCE|nr:hypothetical protein PRZ48_007684 [Zasmidium cellare]